MIGVIFLRRLYHGVNQLKLGCEAGYLPDYQLSEEEMPGAYVVILLDKNIRKNPGHDAGIAAMSVSMVAYDEGLGSCILGAVDREKLKEILNIPDGLDIVLVVALGYPAEKSGSG